MSAQSQLIRSGSLLLGSFTLVVGGVFIGTVAPAWLGWNSATISRHVASSRPTSPLPPSRPAPPPPRSQLGAVTIEMSDLPPIEGGPASYDDIVVEVRRDGSVLVFGERIELSAFRLLLGTQLEDHVDTMVTIRPDDDCPYRHIQPVIAACETLGVRHHMVSSPGASISCLDRPASLAFAAGA